jgi:Domain of unknown function (DUF6984)
MKIKASERPMTMEEARLLDLLFSVDFSGKREIQQQLSKCLVRVVDENGSLEFSANEAAPANVRTSVPVTARLPDADGEDTFGISVNLLLHVYGGVAKELEIYKDDGSSIKWPLKFDKSVVMVS